MQRCTILYDSDDSDNEPETPISSPRSVDEPLATPESTPAVLGPENNQPLSLSHTSAAVTPCEPVPPRKNSHGKGQGNYTIEAHVIGSCRYCGKEFCRAAYLRAHETGKCPVKIKQELAEFQRMREIHGNAIRKQELSEMRARKRAEKEAERPKIYKKRGPKPKPIIVEEEEETGADPEPDPVPAIPEPAPILESESESEPEPDTRAVPEPSPEIQLRVGRGRDKGRRFDSVIHPPVSSSPAPVRAPAHASPSIPANSSYSTANSSYPMGSMGGSGGPSRAGASPYIICFGKRR